MLSFKEFFLLENTVSQMLKDPKFEDPEIIKRILAKTALVLSTNERFTRINPDIKQIYIKWLAFQSLKLGQQNLKPGDTDEWVNKVTLFHYLYNLVDIEPDYVMYLLVDRPDQARSKFNNPDYTPPIMEAESKQWHERMERERRGKAPAGRAIPLAGMPPGWTWVSLDCSSSDEEGEAMGHCGNAGWREGDNIYSLRDARGHAHLTFIVNDGVLGESKGVGNSKPAAKYHPMIVALLLGQDRGRSIVDVIEGGGYLPQNNFEFRDLSPELQREVLARKPYLNDLFMAIKEKYVTNPQELLLKINELTDSKFETLDLVQNKVVYKKFDHLDSMVEWLRRNTESEISIPENVYDWDFGRISPSELMSQFESYADNENDEMMDDIVSILAQLNHVDEEEIDVEEAMGFNDDLQYALENAYSGAVASGLQSEIFHAAERFFRDEKDDNLGFVTEKDTEGNWRIASTFENLTKLWRTDNLDNIPGGIKYLYVNSEDWGWDESAFNDLLHDELPRIKETLANELKDKRTKGQLVLPGIEL